MKRWRLFTGVLQVCFCLLVAQAVQAQQTYDWSAPRLIPVKVDIEKHKVLVAAGGERIEFAGQLFTWDADGSLHPTWSKTGDAFTTIQLNLEARQHTLLRTVKWFSGKWSKYAQREVHSTSIMDNVVFLRKGSVSFFLSLDFPYSKIDDAGIQYPPNLVLEKGNTYAAHSITIGACRLSGERVGRFDRAEIEAISAYVEKRHPSRIQRPMVLSSSITNRMTDVRDGRIFYSMYDNPTIALHPDLVEKDLRLNAELGIEYYQVFEGAFDWPDEETTGNNLKKLLSISRSLGIKMGDYAVPQGLYCPHFNYYGRKVNRPDWQIKSKAGALGAECLGVQDYRNLLIGNLVEHNRKYGLQLICLDFLNIQPCYATGHGHPPGDVYQQIKGIVDLMSALNALDGDFLVWSNSGNWIDLMPKLVWYNPNVYLTDPHVRQYAPHLNILKNLGDGRREQMVSVHEQYFVPYTSFTNYEYYLAPDSRLSDTKVFEYSFLQGLAVTPNLGLGEIRSMFERIPSKDETQLKAFAKFWLAFIRTHYDVWKSTLRLGDPPGVGAAEAYAHIKGDSGFVCLVNQNAFPVTKTLTLNGSMGLAKGDAFLLQEIYPGSGPVAEQRLPSGKRNDSIRFTLAPYSVRIIEITGHVTALSYPLVYGAGPVTIEKEKNSYAITLSLPQGLKQNLGVVLPAGEFITGVTAGQSPTVPMYTFPVSAQLTGRQGNISRISVQAPREAAPQALTQWRINTDSAYTPFPSHQFTGFLGAYVHNAFTENYTVRLTIQTAHGEGGSSGSVSFKADDESPTPARQVPLSGIVTYTTNFQLPFIERYGQDRNEEDDAIVELGFSDPKAVKIRSAWLNNREVPVSVFRNAKNPDHITYYLELRGQAAPGDVELKLEVEYLR